MGHWFSNQILPVKYTSSHLPLLDKVHGAGGWGGGWGGEGGWGVGLMPILQRVS